MPAKPVIGLIGGIGAGKSEVAAAFARLGGALISGDKLGHAALEEPGVKEQIIVRFGKDVVGPAGKIDRRKLGAIVFADVEALKTLEKMVFPSIEAGIVREIAAASENPNARFIVLDAALLLEAGWNNSCTKIVYIDTPRDQRLARLALQRGWTPQEVESRERAQWSLKDKASRADASIDNTGPPSQLDSQAAQLLNRWFFAVAS
jgi:dephospho-CoA kinase